jgi:acyl-homoserine lactone acylase PvdQ
MMAGGSQFYLTTATALLVIAGFPLTSTAAPAPITEVQTPREPGPLMAPGKSNIIRDEWGMAHIYAAREEDGFFALGYATAEDRIDQLLLIYLATKGELAANFGPGPIDADKVTPHLANAIKDSVASDVTVRRFRILESARENLAQLPEQYRRNLDAYIAGINRYLADNPAKRPAWAPVLEPAMPLAAFSQLVAEAAQICPSRIAALESKAPAPAEPALKGSNAWVAGPSRVANGGVLFSSDSHGPWSAIGTLFYAWRMKAGDFDFQAFEPTGTAINIGELFTGVTDRRRIDNGQHFFQMLLHQPIKQRFVIILNSAQINMLINRIFKAPILLITAAHLLFDGFITGR